MPDLVQGLPERIAATLKRYLGIIFGRREGHRLII